MPGPAEIDDLVVLATACLRADGGLPLTAEPAFLAGRWGAAGATTRLVRTRSGGADPVERGPDAALVAAAVLRDGPRLMTLVHPSERDSGVEAELLDWGLGLAPDATVETESSTAERERLYASRGLRRTFGEEVLRYDLTHPVPAPAWPDGVTLTEWSAAMGERFHSVYHAAFQERPGYPGGPAADWIEAVTEEDTFRPAWSLLATDDRLGDAGFITAAVGWIDQVGVVPAARGRGLGAALVLEALRRMRAAGETEAWLAVNVDNPAGALYRRLGFEQRGRRARFQRAEPAGERT